MKGLTKIIQGIKNFRVTRAVGIGISSAALLYSGGCESPEGNIALSTVGNMTQASPYTSPKEKVAGVGASTIGEMGYEMNKTKAGKPEVNVYINDKQEVYQKQPTKEELHRINEALDRKFRRKQPTKEELHRINEALDRKFRRK